MDISELLMKDDEIKKAIEDRAIRLTDICRGNAVYHYTDLNALKGIVENKVFWATEYNYLNDEEEFVYVQNVLASVLRQEFGEINESNEYRDFLLTLYETMISELVREYYVVSFSLNPDNLTLWAEFANPGCNVKCDISGLFDYGRYNVAAVVYDIRSQMNIVRVVILTVLQHFFPEKSGDHIPGYLDGEDGQTRSQAAYACARFVAYYGMFMKSDLFKAEEEYRAVFRCEEGGRCKYRVSRSRFVPYIEVPIKGESMPGLLGVTLAPLNRSKLDVRAMGMFCSTNGLNDVKVGVSGLRLRF